MELAERLEGLRREGPSSSSCGPRGCADAVEEAHRWLDASEAWVLSHGMDARRAWRRHKNTSIGVFFADIAALNLDGPPQARLVHRAARHDDPERVFREGLICGTPAVWEMGGSALRRLTRSASELSGEARLRLAQRWLQLGRAKQAGPLLQGIRDETSGCDAFTDWRCATLYDELRDATRGLPPRLRVALGLDDLPPRANLRVL